MNGYETIKTEMQARIVEGRYKPGDKLPTVKELAEEFGVNINTAVKGMHDLKTLGILEAKQGRGYTVRDTADLTGFRESVKADLERISALAERLGLTGNEKAKTKAS